MPLFLVNLPKQKREKGFLYHKLAEKTLYHLTFVKKRSKLRDGLCLENFNK